MSNYIKYFEFTSIPFHKSNNQIHINENIAELEDKFKRLIDVPGVGMVTGNPGCGKTTVMKYLADKYKGPRVEFYYLSETDFSRNEFYMVLADRMGVETSSKRSIVWKNIKKQIMHQYSVQNITPIIIVDEAHNLPLNVYRDMPSFLNFEMDSQDPVTLWLCGLEKLSRVLSHPESAAISSRVRTWQVISPVTEPKEFAEFIKDGFKRAGATANMITDSGINNLLEATAGEFRKVSNIIVNALQRAAQKEFKHIPDNILNEAILEIR